MLEKVIPSAQFDRVSRTNPGKADRLTEKLVEMIADAQNAIPDVLNTASGGKELSEWYDSVSAAALVDYEEHMNKAATTEEFTVTKTKQVGTMEAKYSFNKNLATMLSAHPLSQ